MEQDSIKEGIKGKNKRRKKNMVGIIEIITGLIILVVGAVLGGIRIFNVPRGWNFSGAACKRYLVFTLAALAGGIALIVFGAIAIQSGGIQ